MAYQTNFKILKTEVNSVFRIEDISIGDETILTTVVKVIKTDLTETIYTIPSQVDYIDINILVDSALRIVFTKTVTTVNPSSKYTTTKDFITRNFIDLKISKRLSDLRFNKNVVNKQEHINTTMEINFHLLDADDRVRFSDLKGAQTALDYVNDVADKY